MNALRKASCCCGGLNVVCEGDPILVAMCHCEACQRRTGSVFGVQAFFAEERVTASGEAKQFVRPGASGKLVTFEFCPSCGATLFWRAERRPGEVGVAVGAFADPGFEPPGFSILERSRHAWTEAIGALSPLRRSE